jgi:hypothetical protein
MEIVLLASIIEVFVIYGSIRRIWNIITDGVGGWRFL